MLLVSFHAHMCLGDQECFIPRAKMTIVPGKKAAHRDNPTAANQAQPPPYVAGGGGDGSCGSGVADVLPLS